MLTTDTQAVESGQGGPHPVIVLAAFGSSQRTGLANLNDLDNTLRAQFQGYDVRWAFTSGYILKKLRQAGVETVFDSRTPLQSLDEVYEKLRQENVTQVAVQCVLVLQGFEARLVLSCDPAGLEVRYGLPLLGGRDGIRDIVQALSSEFGDRDTATIICAHGNSTHREYNAALIELDAYVRARYANTFVAAVEGRPDIETAIAAIRASGTPAVRFVPLMLTEGDHMQNDILGDEPDSWKTLLGLPATHAGGLASNPNIARLFEDRIRHLLAQF